MSLILSVTSKSCLAGTSSFSVFIHINWALYVALLIHLPVFLLFQTPLTPTLSNILRGRPISECIPSLQTFSHLDHKRFGKRRRNWGKQKAERNGESKRKKTRRIFAFQELLTLSCSWPEQSLARPGECESRDSNTTTERKKRDLIPKLLSIFRWKVFRSYKRGIEVLMSHHFLRSGIQVANQLIWNKYSKPC